MAQKISDAVLPVSVIVLTYNASWERVRATLNSAILQKDIDFELIISDDCSRENYFEKMRDFFSRNSFTNYKLIKHDENLGTVKNFLEAAKISSGKYIRGIGQGDMFLDEYTLRDSYNHMAENNSAFMTFKAVYFQAFTNPVKLIKFFRHPQNIKAYENPDDLRESYLMNGDRLSGATVMYERETLVKYFTEAANWKENGVFLVEDTILKLMVFDKVRASFFDRNAVFYEYGIGVSTSLQNMKNLSETRKISEKIAHDEAVIDDMLLARCEASPSEFSERLRAKLESEKNFHEKENARQSFKKKLGALAIPLMIANRLRIYAKNFLSRSSHQDTSIKTDINVSPDFANLCINRE